MWTNLGIRWDLSVSEDGLLIMVTYQFVEGSSTKSYVAFYNFGTVGQNKVDNIVSGFTYDDVVIPQVAYLDKDTAVAFRMMASVSTLEADSKRGCECQSKAGNCQYFL